MRESKRCTRCGEKKSLEEFPRQKRVKDGRAARCKTCTAAETAAWRLANPDYKERAAEWIKQRRALPVVDDPTIFKRCSRCGQEKGLGDFHHQAAGRYGRESLCKVCKAERYQERAAEISEHGKQRYANDEAFREKKAQDRAAWNAANRDRIAENDKAWREANPGYKRERTKARYWADPERARAEASTRNSRRRARKLAAFVEDVDRETCYRMYGGQCGICLQFIDLATETEPFHIDHVIPLSKGGLHCYANCRPAHAHCNAVKFDRVGFTLTAN